MFEIKFKHDEEFSLLKHSDNFIQSMDIKLSSKLTYKRQLKEFLNWIKIKKITTPTRQDILSYKDYLKEKKDLSTLTIAGYLTATRRFFQWLENSQIYPNIVKDIKNPKRKRGFKKDALTVDQVQKLLTSIKKTNLTGLRDFAILNLMIRTGLRTIEIARIQREDISQQSGQTVLWIHGKGRDSKDEIVILTPDALEPINEYMHARKKVRSEDFIFISHSSKNKNKGLTTRSISRIVKNNLKNIGIDDTRITAHSLRHTAITLSLLAGASPQEARTMARHADINTTMIYAHNIDRIKQAPEHKIDKLLKK